MLLSTVTISSNGSRNGTMFLTILNPSVLTVHFIIKMADFNQFYRGPAPSSTMPSSSSSSANNSDFFVSPDMLKFGFSGT